MKVPKYVIHLLERSNVSFDKRFYKHEHYAVGYTIEVHKRTEYAYVDTLKEEVERLQKFVTNNNGHCEILSVPNKTHYHDQYAVVTIFDPVMKHLEQYIKK